MTNDDILAALSVLSDAQAVTLYELVARHWNYDSSRQISPIRLQRFVRAITVGAPIKTLHELVDANRTSDGATIVLPPHRYENLSRGKGWARKGRGTSAVWGERTDGGYEVGPGRWTVGGNDGFSRKGETEWTVKHIVVGTETWTVAN